MRATKSSKLYGLLKFPTTIASTDGAAWWEYAGIAVLVAMIGVLAALWHHSHGYPLYYGDAESHLDTARRIVDSRTPATTRSVVLASASACRDAPVCPLIRPMDKRNGGNNPWRGLVCSRRRISVWDRPATFGSFAAGARGSAAFRAEPEHPLPASGADDGALFLAAIAGIVSSRSAVIRWPLLLFCCAATLSRYEGWAMIPAVA